MVSFSYYNPLSEPKRERLGLRAALQQTTQTIDNDPVVTFSYFNNLSDPVRRIGFKTHLQPDYINPAYAPQPLLDYFGFYAWWSEPQRQKIGLKTHLQSTTTFDPDIEFPISYGYYNPFSEPVRQKIGIRAALQQPIPPTDTDPVVTFSYFNNLSDPVRRVGFKTHLQPDYINPAYAPQPLVDYFGFYAWLSEPQRQKPGLKTALQSTITSDPQAEFPVKFGYYNPLSDPVRRKGINTAVGVEANWYVHWSPTADHISWWNNFSEPVRKYGLRVAAEPASFFTYNEPINYISWWRDFSTPVIKPTLRTANQQANWFVYFPVADLGYISWWTNFSDPVRRRGMRTEQFDAYTAPEIPTVPFSYYNWLTEPVRQKAGLKTHLQSTTTFNPKPEFPINVSSWWANFTDPVRRAGIKVSTFDQANYWVYFTPPTDLGYMSWWKNFDDPVRRKGIQVQQIQAFASPHLQPTVTFGYYNWWSEPQRSRVGLAARLQRETAAPFNPTVSFSYYSRLSEPQRLYKPRLNVALQQFYTANIFPLPTAVAPAWFFEWLSEPVRLKQGLSARLQQTFAWPPKIIAGQVVTGIINAFQLNTDTAEISVFVRNYNIPTHAIVSVEEVVNGYNVSIPHYLTSIQEVSPISGSVLQTLPIFQPNVFQNNVFQVTGGRTILPPVRAIVSIEEIGPSQAVVSIEET